MTITWRVIALTAGLAISSAGLATARDQRSDRLSDQQLKDLVERIDTHRGFFGASIARAIDRSRLDGSQAETEIDRSVKFFGQAADRLRDRVNDRRANVADAEDVLRRATLIDTFMVSDELDAAAQIDWQAVRVDMHELAGAYDLPWGGNAESQRPAQRVDDEQIRELLKRIDQKADRFEKSLERSFDRARAESGRGKDEIAQAVKDVKQAADRLASRVRGHETETPDVEAVMRPAARIARFVKRDRLSTQAEELWLSLRSDLDELARIYDLTWN